MVPTLHVSVRIEPLDAEISNSELDALFGGEVSSFEKWFMENQRRSGVSSPSPLISAEHGIVRAYLYYLHTGEVK